MPQKLRPFEISDFSGGLVLNASDKALANNEFKNTRNFDIDEKGRLIRRRGFRQCGQTTAAAEKVHNSIYWLFRNLGNVNFGRHIITTEDTSGGGSGNIAVWRLVTNYLTAAAATTDTTLTVADNTLLAASGTVEVNGDLIAYTGKSGTTGLTGVTGIARAHPVGSLVNQNVSVQTAIGGFSGRDGIGFSFLNNNGFIGGRGRNQLYDGTSITAGADTDMASGLMPTNYRNRIYVAGSGISDANYNRNGSPIRISNSDAGNADSWDVNEYRDAEDENNEMITSSMELNDKLGIFKLDSIWTFDEVELKRRIRGVGAFNHKVTQKHGNLIYTFGPTGIWETNLFSARLLSKPVEKYLKGYHPAYGGTSSFGRHIENCCAAIHEDKYILYIGDITDPETLSDVALVYDILKRRWTVYTDFPSNLLHLYSTRIWGQGNLVAAANTFVPQTRQALFGGDDVGKYYRFFDDKFLDNAATRTARGGDFTEDISSETRLPITAVLETKFFDLNAPGTWKDFGYLKLKIETGDFHVAYRLDLGSGQYSDWISLGNFTKSHSRKRIRDYNGLNQQGFRISLKISTSSADVIPILNGFLFEEAQVINEGYAREGT